MRRIESKLNTRDEQFNQNAQSMRMQVGDLHAQMAIHAAGGVAVWAHPFERAGTAEAEVSDRLDHFAELGIDGVEAFYVLHTAEQARFVARRAAELGLLTTGSADFHGPGHAVLNAFGNFALHGCEPRLGPIGAA